VAVTPLATTPSAKKNTLSSYSPRILHETKKKKKIKLINTPFTPAIQAQTQQANIKFLRLFTLTVQERFTTRDKIATDRR